MLYGVIWCYMMLYDVLWWHMMAYDGILSSKKNFRKFWDLLQKEGVEIFHLPGSLGGRVPYLSFYMTFCEDDFPDFGSYICWKKKNMMLAMWRFTEILRVRGRRETAESVEFGSIAHVTFENGAFEVGRFPENVGKWCFFRRQNPIICHHMPSYVIICHHMPSYNII